MHLQWKFFDIVNKKNVIIMRLLNKLKIYKVAHNKMTKYKYLVKKA